MSEDNDKERRERIKRLRKQDEPESESSISPEELNDQMAQWQRGQLTHWEKLEQEAERKHQQQDEKLKRVLEENGRLRETLRRASTQWVTRTEWTQEVPEATARHIRQMGRFVKGWFWKLAGITVLCLCLLVIGLLVWIGQHDDRDNGATLPASDSRPWTLERDD